MAFKLTPSIFNIFYKSFRRLPRYSKNLTNSDDVLDGLIAYNQHGGYFVPLSSKHRPAAQSILNGQVYEPRTIRFMENHCGDGDVVHAGTYFGDFLPGLSKSMDKNAIIWAFEPNRENFRCAQITVKINNIKNVVLKDIALSAKEGKCYILVQTEEGIHLGGTSTIVNKSEKGKKYLVRAMPLDSIIPKDRNITIMQFDVEGHEKKVLKGALKTIQRCKPILILEDFNKSIETTWFEENILSLGYKIIGNIHYNTVLKI